MSTKTVYEVHIIHAAAGRRVIIRELLQGRWRKEVANFVCLDIDETDWLARHGKRPCVAYRVTTTELDEQGEVETATAHAGYVVAEYPASGQ
jgi:hypothetical protein